MPLLAAASIAIMITPTMVSLLTKAVFPSKPCQQVMPRLLLEPVRKVTPMPPVRAPPFFLDIPGHPTNSK